MLAFRRKLPAYAQRDELIAALRNEQVLVVSGETGCGKTTQVPQFLLEDAIERGEGGGCSIICTQPRRISAISVVRKETSLFCNGI
jgi:HrpA-like RNA helicase